MPALPAKPCRKAGCNTLTRDPSGHCDRHQGEAKPGSFADKRRGTAASRGYGYDWQKRRQRVMQRDSGLCQPCLKAGRVSVATDVDHIKPRSEQGTDDDDNLQAICRACHTAKTATESARSRASTARRQSS
jgi:5-methylcytosine-specific restriction protein A